MMDARGPLPVPDVARAAVLEGANRIGLRTYPVPKIRDDQMLVAIGLCGICGSDIHRFHHIDIPSVGAHYKLPLLMGHEITGRLAAIGSRAREVVRADGPLAVGDRVVVCASVPGSDNYGYNCAEDPPHLTGGWADYLLLQPGSRLWKIPDEVPFEVAVLTEPFGVAIRSVEKALAATATDVENRWFPFGGAVAVLGAGAIGLLVALACRLAGVARIVVLGAPPAALDLARDIGVADETVNVLETTPDERVKAVREFSRDGAGADAVFEAAGRPEAFVQGLEMLRRNGVFVELGCMHDTGATVPVNVPRHLTKKDTIFFTMAGVRQVHLGKALATMRRLTGTVDLGLLVRIASLDDTQGALLAASDEATKSVKTAFAGAGYAEGAAAP
jgi:L-iditol 2-dehydrogenase